HSPYSPDLVLTNFFLLPKLKMKTNEERTLWDFIKNCVYARPATTRDDMKNRIRTVCYNISHEVLLRTIDSF
ncbi:hypothetical protein X777_05481, partial [Ooceraea biroi]